jgi:hypothetical protein
VLLADLRAVRRGATVEARPALGGGQRLGGVDRKVPEQRVEARRRRRLDAAAGQDAGAKVVEIAGDDPVCVPPALAEPVTDQAPHRLGLGLAQRQRAVPSGGPAGRGDGLEMAEIERQPRLAEIERDLEAVAVEDAVAGLDPEPLQRLVVAAELGKARLVMRGDDDLVGRDEALSRRKRDVDAARVVAVDELEMAVADVRDTMHVVREEGAQDAQIVDLLQRDDVGPRLGDGERGELALVVLDRDRDRGFDLLAGLGLREVEQRQRRRGLGPLARAEAVARGEVLDVEGRDAKAHEAQTRSTAKRCVGETSSSCAATTRISREPAAAVRLRRP